MTLNQVRDAITGMKEPTMLMTEEETADVNKMLIDTMTREKMFGEQPPGTP